MAANYNGQIAANYSKQRFEHAS